MHGPADAEQPGTGDWLAARRSAERAPATHHRHLQPPVGRDGDGDGVRDPFDPADAIPAQAVFDCSLAAGMAAVLRSGRVAAPSVTSRWQVVVVWTDDSAHPLDPTGVPAELRDRVSADFSALTDPWEEPGSARREQQAADSVRAGRPGVERHLRSVGERGAQPVAGRWWPVGRGLRDDVDSTGNSV